MKINPPPEVDEKYFIETVNEMCIESLPPDMYEQWEKVMSELKNNRKALKELNPKQPSPSVTLMNRSINALALELPEQVWNSVNEIWQSLLKELELSGINKDKTTKQ
jgi:hypothetical protein